MALSCSCIVTIVIAALLVVAFIVVMVLKYRSSSLPVAAAGVRVGKRVAIKELNTAAEVQSALASPSPALVFVYADWCGHCKRMTPVYDEFANESSAALYKINEAKIPDFLRSQGVNGFPTFLSNVGEKKSVGAKTLDQLRQMVASPVQAAPKRCAIHGQGGLVSKQLQQ